MKRKPLVRSLWLALLLAASTVAAPAFAQVNIHINLAPPAPQYEVAPALAPGYIWVPGYWAWSVDHHIWIRGRAVVQRAGYRWEPDRWEQRDHAYYRLPGRWMPDADHQVIKVKKEKKPKHWDNRQDHDERGHDERGHGDAGKHGKDRKHD